MGWNSANEIFNPVAEAVLQMNAPDTEKTEVLRVLIAYLQGEDWDTEGESLELFELCSPVVEAFRLCGVEIECG